MCRWFDVFSIEHIANIERQTFHVRHAYCYRLRSRMKTMIVAIASNTTRQQRMTKTMKTFNFTHHIIFYLLPDVASFRTCWSRAAQWRVLENNVNILQKYMNITHFLFAKFDFTKQCMRIVFMTSHGAIVNWNHFYYYYISNAAHYDDQQFPEIFNRLIVKAYMTA